MTTPLAIGTLLISAFHAGSDPSPVVLAYIDLGTGSMIIQILAAGLLSAAVAFRRLRMQVMYLLSRPFRRRPLPPSAAQPTIAPASPSGDRTPPSH